MKKTERWNRFTIRLLFLAGFWLVSNYSNGQSIGHAYGSYCAGSSNVFYYAGPGGVLNWITNGTITGGGGSSSSVTVVWNSPTTGGFVECIYSSQYGSGPIYLTPIVISSSVTPSVSITTGSTNICSGSAATFTASSVNGGSSPYYTWYVNGSSVASGYSNTFSTSSLTNGQQVYCAMSSNASCASPNTVNSNVITMTVGSPQQLGVTISGNTSVCQGSGTYFTASASGQNLSYQWKKNGVNVNSDVSVPANVLVQNFVSSGDTYSCVVSAGNCSNPATSNLLSIMTVQPQTFSITTGINSLYFCEGSTATFTATPSLPVSNYQWYMNGIAVPGATSSTFATTANSVSQLQSVYVTANTSASCVNSSSATGSAQNISVAVNPTVTPLVSISASSSNVCAGSLVTFTANPVNSGSSPSYTWFINGSPAGSGSSNSFSSSSISNGQQVNCVLTSNAGCVTSPTATSNTITLAVNPSVTMGVTISGATTVCQGRPASFNANVSTGTGNLSYQWKKNGQNVNSEGTSPSALVLSSLNNNDVLTCLVSSDGCASPVTSNALTITTVQPQPFSLSLSPSSISLCQNGLVTFTCNATNSASNYQWMIGGHLVDQATGNTYTTGVVSVGQLQSVNVTASTIDGCVNNTSATAYAQNIPFTVNAPVTPDVSITNATPVLVGSPVSFTANVVNGGIAPAFQWQLNGTDIPGATGASYTKNFTSGAQFQTIGLVVHPNAFCVLDPSPVTKTIELSSPLWEDRTYVSVHTILKKGLDDWVTVQLLPIGDKLQTTTYLDGLSRPVQEVNREVSVTANNSWNDLVKVFDYPELNVARNFIPYSSANSIGKYKSTALNDQVSYIQSFFGESSSAPTYFQTISDNSPLDRITKNVSAGSNWGTGVTTAYDFNEGTENVHIWNLSYSNSAIPNTTATQVYPTGSLYKMISTDEKGYQTISYAGFDGKVILKKIQNHDAGTYNEHGGWACTYYVYDDLAQLRYTITPKAVEWLDNNGWNLSQAVVDGLCYKYVYDERGRVIVKKQPEADEQYLVYDRKNRVVLVQTANQRKVNNSMLNSDQWSFTLFDELGNELSTGLLDNNSDRNTIQNAVNNLANGLVTVSAFVGGGSYQSFVADNPVAGNTSSTNFLAGNTNITFNSISLYDNYNYIGAKSFNNTYSFYNNNNPDAEPTIKTNRTVNFITGQKVRVIDNDNNPLNDQFLNSTVYYDEEGKVLQSLMDNYKNGVDYQTNQYDFSGKILSSYTNHVIGGGTIYTVISRNVYDRIGRLKELHKSFNGSSFKELAEYNYDELGQIKSKRIDPTSANSQMETQDYSYNINGLLTGINKGYALNNNNYSQWDRYFSEYLGYNNNDNLFAAAQLAGKVTGIIWRTQGDNASRRYDYTYDHIGRLTSALFKQKAKPSDASWSNSNMDFSVYLQYEDGNGNIKSMKQMGVVPGSTGLVIIDDLRYSYIDISGVSNLRGNRLKQVDDWSNLGNNNGMFGDFNDKNITQDYDYDKEGNLTQDLNKNIQANGITYNYLNKPIKIVLANKSQVEYCYDASGEKLYKKVTQFASSANNNVQTVTTTDYVGDFIYQTVQSTPQNVNTDYTDKLQFILHEEGRLKMITPVVYNPNSSISNELSSGVGGIAFSSTQHGVFEFFIKDHLGSTRMVLTEEVQKEYYTATMENSAKNVEDGFFGRVLPNGAIDQTNELEATRIVNTNPTTAAWPNHANDFVKLTGANSSTTIGPNMMLKVMAGDLLTTSAKYYYANNNSTSGSTDPLVSVPSTIINAVTSPNKGSKIGKTFSSGIQPGLQADMFNFLKNTEPLNGNINAPKAYINIVFLDEQFNFIDKDPNDPGVGTDFMRVSSANDPNAYFPLFTQKAPKNGWVFIYLSNESVEPVYFDDFKVIQEHSRISEETHYYPFGLKISAICSKKFTDQDKGTAKNSFLFNGKEMLDDDADLSWYEYGFRNYDPQIGRFTQLDPLASYFPFLSPYQFAGNDPVSNVDLDGLEPAPSTGIKVVVTAIRPKGSALIRKVVTSPITEFAVHSLVTQYVYQNSRGHQFVEEFPVFGGQPNLPNTQMVLGEQWTLSGTNTYETISYRPIAGSGATMSNASPPKVSSWQKFWTIFRYARPTEYQLINSPVVGLKTFGSGLFGYDKTDVRGLDGDETTFEERYWGGVGILASVTGEGLGQLGSELAAVKSGTSVTEEAVVHGNSLRSSRPTWGYKLYSEDGTFLKNGITSKAIPETRYTKAFMADKYMEYELFPNRLAAYQWEYGQNVIQRGPLNLNMH